MLLLMLAAAAVLLLPVLPVLPVLLLRVLAMALRRRQEAGAGERTRGKEAQMR